MRRSCQWVTRPKTHGKIDCNGFLSLSKWTDCSNGTSVRSSRLYDGGVTSGLVNRTGDVSRRHLFVRVAYLQDERQLARVSPEEFGFGLFEHRLPFTLKEGNPHKQVASENVSRFRWSASITIDTLSPMPSKRLSQSRTTHHLNLF